MWTDIIYSCECHWYYFRQTWLSPSDFWEYGNIMHVEFANWKMQQNDMAGGKSNGKKNLVFCNTINSPWLIRMQHFINLKPLWAPGFEVTSIKRKRQRICYAAQSIPLLHWNYLLMTIKPVCWFLGGKGWIPHRSHGHKIVPG